VSSAIDRKAQALFAEYARTRDRRLRDEIIALHQHLVRYLASKFSGRGEPLDDLLQVANIGLVNAVDRFNPDSGHKFSTFATPTIVGEIRRHFRDRAWSIKVPRRLQELNQAATRAVDTLTARLGRSPTYSEIAQEIGASEEETLTAVELSTAYETLSIDALVSVDADSNPLTVAEFVGVEDETLTRLQKYGDLNAALDLLTERERDVIILRFFREMSQAEVARRLEISQMHVSRLQSRALQQLRKRLGGH
jgi:RNA polymerase sigma-B factor